MTSERKVRLLEKLAGRPKPDAGARVGQEVYGKHVQRLKMRIGEDQQGLNDPSRSRLGRRARKTRYSANKKMLKSIPSRYHRPGWTFSNRIHESNRRNDGPVGVTKTKLPKLSPGHQAAQQALNRGPQGPFTRVRKQLSRIPHVAAYNAAMPSFSPKKPPLSPKKPQLVVATR